MNQRIWTNEEDEYIKNNFGNKTFSEMAEHIGCAITTVQNRAKFLGFEVEKKTARRWNEEEIELLKIMAPKYLNKTIARKLNRSINELNKKARELGIELIFKRPVWKKWKVKFLRENINILSLSQIQKELEVNYYQIMDKLDELGIEYDNNYWSEEEINILIELSSKVYIRELAKILNRTEGAIISKANKMGLDYITLKKVYTDEELQYIKDNWGIIPVTDMARNLGVSRIMIQAQADKMNLPKLGNNPYRKWTKEEETLLSDLWGSESIENIAKKLNRTVSSITNRVYVLGLGSQIENNYDGLRIQDISDIFQVNRNVILTSWVSLGLKLSFRKRSNHSVYSYVQINNLYEFLEENQNIWDSRNLEKNILGAEPEWLKEKRIRDRLLPAGEFGIENLTKQQLLLAKQYFLDSEQAKETAEPSENVIGPRLVKTKDNKKR